MKKLKKIVINVTLIVFLLILLANPIVFASNSEEQEREYSKQYLEWLELSDEEKQKVFKPRMYDVPYVKNTSQNPLLKASMLTTTLNSRYSLMDIIPSNLAIRNQQDVGSCWAFAALSSLETNLALTNYKNGVNTSKVYDFSERHMEYATTYEFKDGTNPMGYVRTAGSGATSAIGDGWGLPVSYLTNGSGAISETEMPYENNADSISISEIQNKTIASQVFDTVEFPNYLDIGITEEETNEIMNQIKNHIQNYGAVYAGVKAGALAYVSRVSDTTGALELGGGLADHAVSIIGWDDGYSKDNWNEFYETGRPTSDGAWIARNSWGEESGDNGLIYISYEDKTCPAHLYGIIKAADTVEYENIYQHTYYYPNNNKSFLSDGGLICNIFDKKTNGIEYLTQVSLYVDGTGTCKVYVNANGIEKTKNDLELIPLVAGESETLNTGYHTLELLEPIEITSNQYTVAIEITPAGEDSWVRVGCVSKSSIEYYNQEIQTGKSFYWSYDRDHNGDWDEWEDLAEDSTPRVSTIQAFTTSKIIDDSLKNIEITTPPAKTKYWVGENFDATGMVITANYNDDTSRVLGSSDYSISNGTNLKAGQESVTITFGEASVEQSIQVIENKVESLVITTPPTQTEYWAGDDFDKEGMVVEATYTDETTKTITDYEIIDGSNLKNGQTEITISYGGKTVKQGILVKENPVEKIEITKAPNKTKYVVGQNFDKTGMILEATYKNGKVKQITDYEIKDGNDLKEGQATVTIVYEEQTITQEITVEVKAITGIKIKNMPRKTKYIQNKEELDLTGGIIEITYNDDTTEQLEMTADEVTVTGFSNINIGKITLTITYETKTVQFEVEITDEKAENSKMDNLVSDVKKVKVYHFTNESQKDYTLMEIEITGLEKSVNNDKLEYYYYLSSNKNEENIKDWIKISETQSDNDIKFTIDSSKVSNYNEIANANVLYLYVKEVAIKGGNQSVAISKAITIESDVEVETYIDNAKVNNANSGNTENNNSEDDTTVAPNKLPNAGIRNILIVAFVISACGIVVYVKYKDLNSFIK